MASFRRDFSDDHQVLPPQLPVIPSPIGGTPSPVDYAPSCLFLALYALLVPMALYRLCARSSRNLIVVFTLGLIVERIAFFVIRAWEAHAPDSERTSPVFLAYAQSTLAAGFVSVGKDLVAAVRCLLVRAVATRPSELDDELASDGERTSFDKRPAISRSATFADEPPKIARISTVPLTVTMPVLLGSPTAHRWRPRRVSCGWWRWMTSKRERTLYDFACVCMSIAFVIVVALSLGSGGVYAKGMYYQSWANRTVLLRYISCGLALSLISIVHTGAYWAWARNPTMGHGSVAIISAICTLLSVVGIYRLVVMGYQTENLLASAPGSLNDSQSKAAFYVFHVAPEWLAIAILLGVNVRERFIVGGRVDAADADAATVIAIASIAA
ncbi:hypothetical protein L227DRAFT_521180 [Lentinus tigrinus ALCF2SS1-6]|uniref:Uncharacterized protein n=1 Tax=Lentinus tigrinus ALCF2SS1-6 TaxID=1328759 RepID=A0A5C2SLA3_9APHY|nr:hypothetical protein L227DRAFT_521180 [Lentinus tigrinus ALCF2SS1-6]